MIRTVAKIALSAMGAAGLSLLSSLAPVNAVILVEPIVTTVNEDILQMRQPRVLTPDLLPRQEIEYGVPDMGGNFRNDTGRIFDSLVFELETVSYSNSDSTPPFNNEPVQWGDVNGDGKIGFSTDPALKDYFTDVTVTGNVITFTGGEIPEGNLFYNQFSSNPDLRPGRGIIPPAPPPPADQDGPIRVKAFYTTKAAIPEPTSVFGVLFLGALGLSLTVKRKFKQQASV
jgi:hypothetical protein